MNDFENEFYSYFSPAALEKNFYDIGMYKVMQLTTPDDLFNSKIERGSRYVRATQPLLLYYFNDYIMVFFMFIIGCISGLLAKGMMFAVRSGSLPLTIVFSRFFYIFLKAFKDGDLYKIFSLEMLLLLFIVIVFYLTADKQNGTASH